MRGKASLACAFGLLLAAGGCGAPPNDGNQTALTTSNASDQAPVALQIRTASGERHAFTVELAVDDLSQQRGLMGRTTLPEDHGMLFPFPVPRTASFWMKDTPLALDLLFIRPDGTIAAILPGRPNDLHPVSAGEPVSAVLEIRQGRARALGLSPGDRVRWGNCAGTSPRFGEGWQPDRFCPEGFD